MKNLSFREEEPRCADCNNTIAHCDCSGGIQEGDPDPYFN